MVTNNMADQNTAQHVNPQDVEMGEGGIDRDFTQEEMDKFFTDNPDLFGPGGEILAIEETPVNVPDFDMNVAFADSQQTTQSTPLGLPPNTKGPYYDPEIQWHVKSTLPGATPLPPPTDLNFLGPYYAPQVGWHYKMLNPPGAQQAAPNPFGTPQEGFTPASATPFSSAIPSRASTPAVPAMTMLPVDQSDGAEGMIFPQSKSKPGRKKPKYGPAAYLSQNSGGTTAIPSRALSTSQVQYTSAAKRRADDLTDGASTPRAKNKRRYPSVVQVCICTTKSAMKVKRPRNAFILYRTSRKEGIMKQMGNRNNQNVSKLAAQMWKAESQVVKQQYHNMASQESARHKREHPDYKYEPGMKERAKFGSSSCTCGAYKINVACLMKKTGLGSIPQDEADELEASDEDEDAFVPPRNLRYPKHPPQEPVAPMMQPAFPDPSTFGFTPAQQAQAEAHLAQLKRKRAADMVAQEEAANELPLAKRLRPRNTNLSFTEPLDLDMDDDTFANMLIQENEAMTAANGSPAQNTRRATKERNSLSPPGTAHGDGGFDFTSFLAASPDMNWDQFMYLDGDNIDVAPRGSQESQSHSYSLRPRGGSKSPPQL